MTDLTPTLDQLQSWIDKVCYPHSQGVGPSFKDKELASLAFKAGADQELEACCSEVSWNGNKALAAELRRRRRPKPPSLKAQALALLDKAEDPSWDIEDFSIVRQALEALPND